MGKKETDVGIEIGIQKRGDLAASVRPGHGDNRQHYPHFRTGLANDWRRGRPKPTAVSQLGQPKCYSVRNGRHNRGTGNSSGSTAPRRGLWFVVVANPIGTQPGDWRRDNEMKGSAPPTVITGLRRVSKTNCGSHMTSPTRYSDRVLSAPEGGV